jgi:hypothetical protein
VSFSIRYGHKKVKDIVQISSMDDELRNSLWSLVTIHIWDTVRLYESGERLITDKQNPRVYKLCRAIWMDHFKAPLDTLPKRWITVRDSLRSRFFTSKWYEVYDFVEFCANNYNFINGVQHFTDECNRVLEKEMSAYRFIDGTISQITEQEQIDEIETALETNRMPVKEHLNRALELLSDKNKPDYRNSIKESVCALESLVIMVIGENGTLGQLIKKLEDEINLHKALKNAFSNLYGYTSDKGGIRHALTDQEHVKFEDAKFFLVVCSAFINFVESKIAGKPKIV